MRACSAFFLIEPISFLKASSGVILALALYLKVLGHVPFSRWLFSLTMLWLELFIFSWMEELFSPSWRAFFASELTAVLAGFSCSSRGCFLSLWLLLLDITGRTGFFAFRVSTGCLLVIFARSWLAWAHGISFSGSSSSPGFLHKRAASSSVVSILYESRQLPLKVLSFDH